MHRSVPLPLLLLVAISACRSSGRSPAVETCVPGETLIVGCAQACGIGYCEGDPILRFCDGDLGVSGCRSADTSSFVEVDDSCGTNCPRQRVTCPPSGSIAIVSRGYSGRDYLCEWEVEHRGILPPGGRAGETVACAPGAPTEIGCSLLCGAGECEGGVSLRTCDGTLSVTDCQAPTSRALRDSSSSSGCDTRCPQYVVTCPESASLTVVPRSTTTSGTWVCDWVARPAPHRADATEVCSPGVRYFVGCAAGCSMGSCAGNGAIRICDGNVPSETCRSSTDTTIRLAQSNRSSCDSECPRVEVVCPGSGAITVVSVPNSGEGFGCDWTMRAAGLGE